MNFYGREKEQRQLERIFSAGGMQTCVIYGRRRIGKSELIKHTLKNHTKATKGVYYECKQTTEMNNVESLSSLLAEVFGIPRPLFSGIEELLEFIFQQSLKEDIILVLDEYPYLRTALTGLDSILQALIDKYREQSNLKFVLCGSYVETMKALLNSANPLYGRIDRTIHLKAMDYREASFFYQDFSAEDKVRLYSVFGGVPYYNRLIDSSLSVRENIQELIASPGARLENEVSMYLHSEIGKITNTNEVIETLAKGYSRFSDILSQSHVSSSPTLADVLDKLIRMDIVAKAAPINDENNKRKTGYYITDQLSLFYYRYCFRYASQLSIMEPGTFYNRYIDEDFETQYVPKSFESVCRQYLTGLNRTGQIEEPFEKIGKYWFDNPKSKTNGEFDLMTLDRKGYIFYEVKYRKKPVNQAIIDAEIKQVKQAGLDCYRYGFFSRCGFEKVSGDQLILIDLPQLFS